MSPQIDHMEALETLDTAYQLLCEFQITIDQSLEGDHPLVAPRLGYPWEF